VSSTATARLVWERPDGERVVFPLDEETIVVGREDAAIEIDEPLVSRQHARLERRESGWRLVDLGSTNRTRVNGEIVRERDLADGDEIRFARATCRFVTTPGTSV